MRDNIKKSSIRNSRSKSIPNLHNIKRAIINSEKIISLKNITEANYNVSLYKIQKIIIKAEQPLCCDGDNISVFENIESTTQCDSKRHYKENEHIHHNFTLRPNSISNSIKKECKSMSIKGNVRHTRIKSNEISYNDCKVLPKCQGDIEDVSIQINVNKEERRKEPRLKQKTPIGMLRKCKFIPISEKNSFLSNKRTSKTEDINLGQRIFREFSHGVISKPKKVVNSKSIENALKFRETSVTNHADDTIGFTNYY